MKKRSLKDIWQNLFEFILFEKKEKIPPQKLLKSKLVKESIGTNGSIQHTSEWMVQKLTHQHIHGIFIEITLKNKIKLSGYQYISIKTINQYPFPKMITSYLSQHKLFKNKKLVS